MRKWQIKMEFCIFSNFERRCTNYFLHNFSHLPQPSKLPKQTSLKAIGSSFSVLICRWRSCYMPTDLLTTQSPLHTASNILWRCYPLLILEHTCLSRRLAEIPTVLQAASCWLDSTVLQHESATVFRDLWVCKPPRIHFQVLHILFVSFGDGVSDLKRWKPNCLLAYEPPCVCDEKTSLTFFPCNDKHLMSSSWLTACCEDHRAWFHPWRH